MPPIVDKNCHVVQFFLSHLRILIVIADVCVNAVISSMGQVSPHEWATGVAESDELASMLSSVFDDIRRKFTSNVKNEFMVREIFLWINISNYFVGRCHASFAGTSFGPHRRYRQNTDGSGQTADASTYGQFDEQQPAMHSNAEEADGVENRIWA
jgi:hypothetical protein